jgi:hypothetical protein
MPEINYHDLFNCACCACCALDPDVIFVCRTTSKSGRWLMAVVSRSRQALSSQPRCPDKRAWGGEVHQPHPIPKGTAGSSIATQVGLDRRATLQLLPMEMGVAIEFRPCEGSRN